MKFLMVILHLAFVLALYGIAVVNVFASIHNRDTYNLVMAILLYIIALKHEKQVLRELD